LTESLNQSDVKNKEIYSKLTKETSRIKELKKKHKEKLKELETENIRLKGLNKTMGKYSV
jgi:hypothetical protein